MKEIKVMHFVSGLVSGGVEQMLYNYCKYMNPSKYKFIIVYQHEPIETCVKKIESIGCRTIRITARNENFYGNIIDSIDVIKREKPDIVHSHMNLMNFFALYAAKKCDIKIRISHSHIAEKNKGILFDSFASICKKLCIFYASELFACGYEAGEYLYGRKRMNAGNVYILENAIDLDYYRKNEEIRKKFRQRNRLDGKFVVCNIGRFSKQKNHTRLLDIFAEVMKIKGNAVLLLIGTGELEEEIKEKATKLGINENVIFYGTTSNMSEIYSSIDVLVLPSLFEGLPVVSIEIQAANVPAVFSDTIDQACKITDAISFVSLSESNKVWAEKIVTSFKNFTPCDLSALNQQYDIRYKTQSLENKYDSLIGLRCTNEEEESMYEI